MASEDDPLVHLGLAAVVRELQTMPERMVLALQQLMVGSGGMGGWAQPGGGKGFQGGGGSNTGSGIGSDIRGEHREADAREQKRINHLKHEQWWNPWAGVSEQYQFDGARAKRDYEESITLEEAGRPPPLPERLGDTEGARLRDDSPEGGGRAHANRARMGAAGWEAHPSGWPSPPPDLSPDDPLLEPALVGDPDKRGDRRRQDDREWGRGGPPAPPGSPAAAVPGEGLLPPLPVPPAPPKSEGESVMDTLAGHGADLTGGKAENRDPLKEAIDKNTVILESLRDVAEALVRSAGQGSGPGEAGGAGGGQAQAELSEYQKRMVGQDRAQSGGGGA